MLAPVLGRGQQAELERFPPGQARAGQVRLGANGGLAQAKGGGHALASQQRGIEGAGKGCCRQIDYRLVLVHSHHVGHARGQQRRRQSRRMAGAEKGQLKGQFSTRTDQRRQLAARQGVQAAAPVLKSQGLRVAMARIV